MYACLAVTCHLHFWQNDRDFLRATVVTRGWNGYRNKSQHRKSTLEKKILPPFQQGFEPATFQSRVRCSNHWAIPAPPRHSQESCYFLIYTLSRFDYCNCLRMGTPNSVTQPLQKILNFAARLVLLAPRHHHSTPLLEKNCTGFPFQNVLSRLYMFQCYKESPMVPMATFMRESRSNVVASQ